jgi:hypothetical protein
MGASVYACHGTDGKDELTRVCSLHELPATSSAPIWQRLEMSVPHPNHVGLKLLSSEHQILRSFSKAFSRLFGMRIKLCNKDVLGARIKAIDVSEFTISVYEPIIVLVIDEGHEKAVIEGIPAHPSDMSIERHIHGQRVLYTGQGFLNLKLPQFFATFIFMFELT